MKLKDAAESGFKHTVKVLKMEESIIDAATGVYKDCKNYERSVRNSQDNFFDTEESEER